MKAPQCVSWWATSCSAQFWRTDGHKLRAVSVAPAGRPRLRAKGRARTSQHTAAGPLRTPPRTLLTPGPAQACST
eukprot:3671067-Pyramimonas_sp.AAC.1